MVSKNIRVLATVLFAVLLGGCITGSGGYSGSGSSSRSIGGHSY